MLWAPILYNPVYRIQGRLAVLTSHSVDYPRPTDRPFRVLDKTAGVSLTGGTVEIESLRPAAIALMSDIVAFGLDLDNDIDGANLLLNDKNWLITSHKSMPSPSGEADGELYMFLEAAF